MRLRLSLFGAAAVAALAVAGPASAHHGGFCPGGAETGREFAQMHIVPLAHAGVLGHAHKPGHHKGFSACAHAQHGP